MTARVSSTDLVRALTQPTETSAEAAGPHAAAGGNETKACVVAQDYYYREARSLSVWTVLTWVLGAATVAFLLLILVLLASALFEPGDALTKAAKVAAGAGTALATWVTGKGASFVFDRLKEQQLAVTEALATVKTMCGSETATTVQREAAAIAYKPLR